MTAVVLPPESGGRPTTASAPVAEEEDVDAVLAAAADADVLGATGLFNSVRDVVMRPDAYYAENTLIVREAGAPAGAPAAALTPARARQLRALLLTNIWPGHALHPRYACTPRFVAYMQARSSAWFHAASQQAALSHEHTRLLATRKPHTYTVAAVAPDRVFLLATRGPAAAPNAGQCDAAWLRTVEGYACAGEALAAGAPEAVRHAAAERHQTVQRALRREHARGGDWFAQPLARAAACQDVAQFALDVLHRALYAPAPAAGAPSAAAWAAALTGAALPPGAAAADPEGPFWPQPAAAAHLRACHEYARAVTTHVRRAGGKARLVALDWSDPAAIRARPLCLASRYAATTVAAAPRARPAQLVLATRCELRVLRDVAQTAALAAAAPARPHDPAAPALDVDWRAACDPDASCVAACGAWIALYSPACERLTVVHNAPGLRVLGRAPLRTATCLAFDDMCDAPPGAGADVDAMRLLWVGSTFGMLFAFRLPAPPAAAPAGHEDPTLAPPPLPCDRALWSGFLAPVRQVRAVNGRLTLLNAAGLVLWELPDMPAGPPRQPQPVVHVLPDALCFDALDDVVLAMLRDGTVVAANLHDCAPSAAPARASLAELHRSVPALAPHAYVARSRLAALPASLLALARDGESYLAAHPATLALLRVTLAPAVAAQLACAPGAEPAFPPLQYGDVQETAHIHDYLAPLNALGLLTLSSQPWSVPDGGVGQRGAHARQLEYVSGLLDAEVAAWLRARLAAAHPALAWRQAGDAAAADELVVARGASDADDAADPPLRAWGAVPDDRVCLARVTADALPRFARVEIVHTDWERHDDYLFHALLEALRDPACPRAADDAAQEARQRATRGPDGATLATMDRARLLDALCDAGLLPLAEQRWQRPAPGAGGLTEAAPDGKNTVEEDGGWDAGQAHRVDYVCGLLDAERAQWLHEQLDDTCPRVQHLDAGRPLAAILALVPDRAARSGCRALHEAELALGRVRGTLDALAPPPAGAVRVAFAFAADWACHNEYLLMTLVLLLRACPRPASAALAAAIAGARLVPAWRARLAL